MNLSGKSLTPGTPGSAWHQQLLVPVIRFFREDPSHPASRIRGIPLVTGNEVDVDMRDCLAGGLSVVDSDVIAGRGELPVQGLFRFFKGAENGCLFHDVQFENGCYMPSGDNQGVARAHREGVADGEDQVGFGDDSSLRKGAEGTVGIHVSSLRAKE